jgi:hypothetical protein
MAPVDRWLFIKDQITNFLKIAGRKEAAARRHRWNHHLKLFRRAVSRSDLSLEEHNLEIHSAAEAANAYVLSHLGTVKIKSAEHYIMAGERDPKSLQKQLNNKMHLPISSLNGPDGDSSDPATMCNIAADFFSKLYSTPETDPLAQNDFLELIEEKLTQHEAAHIDTPISELELQEALSTMSKSSCPGPDGLTYALYAEFPSLLAPMSDAFTAAFAAPRFPAPLAKGIITLIYKRGPTNDVANYRPISLLNADYKLVSKALTRRLAHALPRLVGPSQFAFIHGKSAADNVMTFQLAIQHLKKYSKRGAAIFLDMVKAYDRVAHSWLFAVLERMGFSPTFCRWIKNLYSASQSAILVNGFVSRFFHIQSGVRQGDALSCALFILAATPLYLALKRMNGLPGVACLPNGDRLSSVQYADDTTVLVEFPPDSPARLAPLLQILAAFYRASNALVNDLKTNLLLVNSPEIVDNPFQVISAEHKVKHLGFTVTTGGLRSARNHWKEMLGGLELAARKIAALNVSPIAKAYLARSRILGTIAYYMMILPMNHWAQKKAMKTMSSALWRGRSAVSYESCSLPVSMGGLGLPVLATWQATKLVSWVKKLYLNPDDLWQSALNKCLSEANSAKRPSCRSVLPFAQSSTKGFHLPTPWPSIRAAWLSIDGALRDPESFEDVLAQPILRNPFLDWTTAEKRAVKSLRTGPSVVTLGDLFSWDDEGWRPPVAPLANRPPRRQTAAVQMIIDKLGDDWLALPRSAASAPAPAMSIGAVTGPDDLRPPIACYHPATAYDFWSRKRLIKPALRTLPISITAAELAPHKSSMVPWMIPWKSWAPRKAAATLWRARLNSLPTGRRIARWAQEPNAGKCQACPNTWQNHSHLFLFCPVARAAWRFIWAFARRLWPRIFIPDLGPRDWPRLLAGAPLPANVPYRISKLWTTLITITFHAIWASRCRASMEGSAHHVTPIIMHIKSQITLIWNAQLRLRVHDPESRNLFLMEWCNGGAVARISGHHWKRVNILF